MMQSLARRFAHRVDTGLRGKTRRDYENKFRLFVAVSVYVGASSLDSVKTVSVFLEYLITRGLRAQTLQSYITALKYYFQRFNLNVEALEHKSVALGIRSVAINAPVTMAIKSTFTITMLGQLVQAARQLHDGELYVCAWLLGFFGFYRLSSLVPPNSRFDSSRYPVGADVVLGPPGARIITKCTKSMQIAGHCQVVQVPKLSGTPFCPVAALKVRLSKLSSTKAPLFSDGNGKVVPAYEIRKVLKRMVVSLGWDPSGLGFHAFRRSGASWAFDHGIPLEHIKTHGGWRSEAIWRYLVSTPRRRVPWQGFSSNIWASLLVGLVVF